VGWDFPRKATSTICNPDFAFKIQPGFSSDILQAVTEVLLSQNVRRKDWLNF